MIKLRTPAEIEKLRRAGAVANGARVLSGSMVNPGITTGEIDREIRRYIRKSGGEPTFLGYNGFPKSACISVNEEIIHGIPGSRRLRSGDIVSIDVGATVNGFVGDCAATFIVGTVSKEAQRLIDVTRECFFEALAAAKPGNRVSDISRAVQNHAEKNGYSLVREYTGHGVGESLHEDPQVPNFIETPRRGGDPRLIEGMVIAIEPMLNMGSAGIKLLHDKWTVVTGDGKASAHYENTILITKSAPEILTRDYETGLVI